MSEAKVLVPREAAVRSAVSVRETSRRTLDQRLFLRFPWLATLTARVFDRLRPDSRVRRVQLQRLIRLALEAYNRRDLDALLISYHPDARFEPPRGLGELGLGEPGVAVGESMRRFWRDWFAAWDEFRIEPREVIDLGDRAVLLGRISGQGENSGARLSGAYGAVVTFERGRIIYMREYVDHAEALEAVGLDA